MPHDPPRRGNLPSVTSEPNESWAPHTPVPQAPTSPPPAMPMAPPRGYEAPRPRPRTGREPPPPARTLTGMPAPPSEPPEDIRDSREIPIETLLRELASKADAERAAKAEAAELRLALAAAEKTTRGDDRKTLLKLAYRLGTPLVLLMGAATAWLTAHTAKVEDKIDRVEQSRTLDKVTTDPLPEKVQTTERAAVDCRAWARAKDDYDRQVLAKLGVVIPEQPNAPPVKAIETRAPKHRPNSVTGAPVLEVLTPPPPLP